MPVMRLRLEATYREKGFFNVRADFERFVSVEDCPIDIYLGDSPEPVRGRVERKSNNNGTPRVHGRMPLREYFQRFSQGTFFDVELRSPIAIRIRPTRGKAND